MSVYGEVVSNMTDLDLLEEACRRAGFSHQIEVYESKNGHYHRWAYWDDSNKTGSVWGRDASLVIHGGLDTQYHACGDTAFVMGRDGKFTAKIDVAHGDAKIKWELIQNWYAMLGAERRARARGATVQFDVDEKTGKITGQVIQGRGVPSRSPVRQPSARPSRARQQPTRGGSR